MTGITILMILILMIICTNGEEEEGDNDIRIAGGEKAKMGQFPFFAQILVMGRDAYVCGGSLIHQQWILTVGHCFPRSRRETQQMAVNNHILVYMGTVKQYYHITSELVWKSYAQAVYQHHAFVINYSYPKKGITNKLQNDIALVHSREPFPLGPYIQIIKLPDAKTNSYVCNDGIIVGSGKTTSRESSGKDVLFARVKLRWLHNLGVELPSWSVRSSVFYSINKWHTGHAMPGDSGGPYICNMTGNIPVLYGVISSNRKYGDQMITEYESVLKFMDFILQSVPGVQIYKQRTAMHFEETKRKRIREENVGNSARSSIFIYFSHLNVFILPSIIKIFEGC